MIIEKKSLIDYCKNIEIFLFMYNIKIFYYYSIDSIYILSIF